MESPDIEEFEGSFNFFKNGKNNLHTFCYHNIYKFAGKFGMND